MTLLISSFLGDEAMGRRLSFGNLQVDIGSLACKFGTDRLALLIPLLGR